MLRRTGILLITAALGIGAAWGVAACGEDREGDVQFEEGGTGTEGTGTEGTSTEGTTPTETGETETESGGSGGAEAPETETSP